jgi:dihydrofolate synthase/folylpolyglutamate synthase
MFTRIGAAAFKKDLTNTLALCEALGHPEKKFKSIHIAGTNGKGSVSHMLAAILQCAGYKTGLYTSPHLRDFRERIRINGALMDEQTVVDFVATHEALFERIEPSFFEMTVALCFDYFAKQHVDIAVIETGLGGRLDSTNVIRPELCVITNIGWDHMDMLGDTLPKIAVEKAGIIKYNIPSVIGEVYNETRPVFEAKAHEEKSFQVFAQDEYSLRNTQLLRDGVKADIDWHGQPLFTDLFCGLAGSYQFHNMLTVLAAVEQLQQQGWSITEEHIREGMAQVTTLTGLMGRWQMLSEKPLTIADTGHNLNGVQFVVNQLKMYPHKQLRMVWGMVRDKDISKILQLLPHEAVYYFCKADLPRALESELLAEQASAFGLQGSTWPSVKEALAQARADASTDDLIFIGGSTFVVAEII